MSKPEKAYIVSLDNNKRFGVSFNEKKELVVLFGKYTDSNKKAFQVIETKTFGNKMTSKFSDSDLKQRETVTKILAPYINDLQRRSEKISGL